jgi:hypothetical protein
MATKKSAKKSPGRKAASPDRRLNDVRKLTKKARDELTRLLAKEQAGTITRRQLRTGLEEVEYNLAQAWVFHFKV